MIEPSPHDVAAALSVAVLVIFVIGFAVKYKDLKCEQRGFKRGLAGLPPESEVLHWPLKYMREYNAGWERGKEKREGEERERKAFAMKIPAEAPPDKGVYRS